MSPTEHLGAVPHTDRWVRLQVIVALSHAIVNVEITKAGKHYSPEKMGQKLEEGSNILKAVFS